MQQNVVGNAPSFTVKKTYKETQSMQGSFQKVAHKDYADNFRTDGICITNTVIPVQPYTILENNQR
jgi:hypothetical protein